MATPRSLARLSEHTQIYDELRKKGVTGLAVVAGDKHSFWAGLTSADLPPRAYDPVGVEFVTGSISAQGLVEIGDRIVKPDHGLSALYYTGEHREIPAINYTLLHGVRAALALSRTSAHSIVAGQLARAVLHHARDALTSLTMRGPRRGGRHGAMRAIAQS
jgi:alkaline phosphatase D